jgi:methylmalonyl-CoA mutase C-terminal domain/subunit
MGLVPRVLDLLSANGQANVLVFVGGIIPDEDIPELLKAGVRRVYGPGTSTTQVVEDIRKDIPDLPV